MSYREMPADGPRESWWGRARAAAYALKWVSLATAGSAAVFAGFGFSYRECNRPPPEPPCVDSVALLNNAHVTSVTCPPHARLTTSQVATGQLATCTCERSHR